MSRVKILLDFISLRLNANKIKEKLILSRNNFI